ncbi:MAG: hypothetical protein ACKVU2_17060 [Saprospiraceae bacterium]
MLRETGWGILLVLLVVTAGLWIPALARLAVLSPALAASAGLVLAGWLHLGRQDGTFLEQTALPAWKTCLMDTAFILLPGALFFLLSANYGAAAAWSCGIAVVLLPNGTLANMRYLAPKITLPGVPLHLFELHTSFRGFPAGWLLAFSLQFGVWYHIAFLLAAIILGLLLLSTVFQYVEPIALLPRSTRALFAKWRQYALWTPVFFLPGILSAVAWQPDFGWLVLYAVVALETYLMLVFFYKYAIWRPGLQGVAGNSHAMIGLLLVLMPGGLLIALPMAARAALHARMTVRNRGE